MKSIGVVGIPEAWSSMRLVEAFRQVGAESGVLDLRHMVLDLSARTGHVDGLCIQDFDGLVIRKIGSPYSPQLLDRLASLSLFAELGMPIFSQPCAIRAVLDRLSCTITLRSHGIPMPQTVITEDIAHAREVVAEFGSAVFKPLYTSKARGMMIIEDGPCAGEQILAFHNAGNATLYIQKWVALPGRDLGVAFLGGQYVGCYARVGHDDSWNTTTHSGGRYEAFDASSEIIELAHQAQAPFGLDFTCVDVAETDNGLIVFEVSAFGGFRGLWEGCHIDAAEHYAAYVLEKLGHAR